MTTKYTYKTKGVCSERINFELDGNIIEKVEVVMGCPGNLLGISKILVGMTIDEVIEKFSGIRCGIKPTSCPDQIARALKEYQSI